MTILLLLACNGTALDALGFEVGARGSGFLSGAGDTLALPPPVALMFGAAAWSIGAAAGCMPPAVAVLSGATSCAVSVVMLFPSVNGGALLPNQPEGDGQACIAPHFTIRLKPGEEGYARIVPVPRSLIAYIGYSLADQVAGEVFWRSATTRSAAGGSAPILGRLSVVG